MEEPQWQIAAGGKMIFEVASVKPASVPSVMRDGYAMDAGNSYRFTGGRFSAVFPLISYIDFGWKLILTPNERRALSTHLPEWVGTDRFEIIARAPISNPTKDQMRLMVQSLLADRFGLVLHFETRTIPVLSLEVAKAGKLGSQLRLHSEGPPCPDLSSPGVEPQYDLNVFPVICELYSAQALANGSQRWAARNTTMEVLAGMIPVMPTMVDRPVVDHTGLTGNFDFTIEFAPARRPAPANGDAQPDPDGPSIFEALKEQLGLKLEQTKSPRHVLVIDHVERPSKN
jgi:bla regulator protein BlaR1